MKNTRMAYVGLREDSVSQWFVASQNAGIQSHTNHTLLVALQAQTQTPASFITQALVAGQQKQTPL